jgi:hypothetical protein
MSKLQALIEAAVNKAIADMLSDGSMDDVRVAHIEPERRVTPAPMAARRRNGAARMGQRKLYEIVRNRRGNPAVDVDLPPSYDAVYQYMLKRKNPVTSRQVTEAVGCPHKTTESALWTLRDLKAVRSFYADDAE